MAKDLRSRRVVISAVSLTDGGPYTILRECLASAALSLPLEWEIFALVHDANIIDHNRVHCISIPSAKKSWLYRLYWEWIGFMRISRNLEPVFWLSLHDITPRVTTKRLAVYCHNASPFYTITLRESIFEPKLLLFCIFYKYLYKVFSWRNFAVVVQQSWIRDELRKMNGHPNIIVAHPISSNPPALITKARLGKKMVFLYPALPRVFKNFEVLCNAAKLLPENIKSEIEIRLTFDGSENKYANEFVKKYKNIHSLNFIGRQNQEEMLEQYAQADTILFPSKLETWGLPISEAKAYSKPLLVANLPYAHESIGNYPAVSFIDAGNAAAWASAIEQIYKGTWLHSGGNMQSIQHPYAKSWDQLWAMLIKDL